MPKPPSNRKKAISAASTDSTSAANSVIGLWTKKWFVIISREPKTTHHKLPQLFFKLSKTDLNP